jgi:SAM-dependent methyltransferase
MQGMDVRAGLERQLRRQSLWLKESWHYLLRTKVLAGAPRARALDVGCGPGYVMEALSPLMDIEGVDIDPDMVSMGNARGLAVRQGAAEALPFDNASFDVVFCSYLVMWLRDPERALKEMRRVSRGWVLCLAEPDYGGRLDHPGALGNLRDIIAEGIKRQGGDPFIGRKLRHLFRRCSMEAEIGVHPGVWAIERLGKEFDDEWRLVSELAGPEADIQPHYEAWKTALANGTLFQYNPVFYALARK